MKRYGLLSELVDEENKQNPNGAKLTLNANGFDHAHSLEEHETDDSSGSEELFVRTLSIRDSVMSDQGRQAASFLQRMGQRFKIYCQFYQEPKRFFGRSCPNNDL